MVTSQMVVSPSTVVAASLLVGEAIVCFLIPLSLIMWMLIAKLSDISLNPSGIVAPIKQLSAQIYDYTGYDPLDGKGIETLVGWVSRAGQWIANGVINFALNLVVLVFVLYFMLVGGRKMERYLMAFLPFITLFR